MAGFLFDTCAAIWIVNNEPLRSEARLLLTGAIASDISVYVSPFTAWEVGMLVVKGRVRLATTPEQWFERLLDLEGVRLAPLTPAILLGSHFLPGTPPNDPADRIIAATARDLDATLVTRDGLLLAYGQLGHVRVQAC